MGRVRGDVNRRRDMSIADGVQGRESEIVGMVTSGRKGGAGRVSLDDGGIRDRRIVRVRTSIGGIDAETKIMIRYPGYNPFSFLPSRRTFTLPLRIIHSKPSVIQSTAIISLASLRQLIPVSMVACSGQTPKFCTSAFQPGAIPPSEPRCNPGHGAERRNSADFRLRNTHFADGRVSLNPFIK